MTPALIAHVDYVTDPEASPDPIGFLIDALAQPGSMLLLAIGFGSRSLASWPGRAGDRSRRHA
jgi:hypothetical protein